MSEDAAALWRKRLPLESSLEGVRFARQVLETHGISVLLPNDEGFPASLHDLGDRTPYVLWVKGVASLVAGDVEERFTVTGARAATSYGVHVAESLAADLAAQLIAYATHAFGHARPHPTVEAPTNGGALKKIFVLLRGQTGGLVGERRGEGMRIWHGEVIMPQPGAASSA